MLTYLKRLFGSWQDRTIGKYSKIVRKINELEEGLKSLSDDQLKAKTAEFKERLAAGESVDDLLPEAYAVVKSACRRLIGTEIHVSGYDQKWDMIPYDVQLIGAIAMHNGNIAEMQTGEGKTLTATLPLYLNALTGKPTHLVTVNDYLAERDCQWTGTILRWLGLTTTALTNATPVDQRGELYHADVVYGTASEFGFDYLRDNSMAGSKKEQVQRGYYFAIIDEVDSVLIDEARTPLIISGPAPESRQMYDELKGSVSQLVRSQQGICNRLAAEAKKILDKKESASKEELESAYHKLWIVSKGAPLHKVLLRMQEDPDIRAEIDAVDIHYHSEDGKKERMNALSGLNIIVDERSSEYELTDLGIQEWQKIAGDSHGDDFTLLDLGHEYLLIDEDPNLAEEQKVEKRMAVQDEDLKRKERLHNLRQMLRAHLLMEKDVDYIIQEGKIVIIDENTGRPQPGRRFSDGLHQAIEAKEGVSIQKETQTYATVTLQNFFRMYDKLSGMTGTGITEAGEFKEIYKLDVLSIPTHKKCVREDANDEIYMTEREKYNAILKEVKEAHEKGRPILMGTESVEVSEKLSRIFRAQGLNHVVLNARHHGDEAEIIANAGAKGAITISTNMAGRGTDIKLAPGVADLGGLYVIGTTRHQSRRIDRQLRGRSARLGDPGGSKFYISFEDQLMRLFASPRLNTMLQRFRPPEGEPISASILNRSIETAQKRVEQRNYNVRKHTLQYDDVMNKQRGEVYSFRNELLHTDDVVGFASEILEEVLYQGAEEHLHVEGEKGLDLEGFYEWLITQFPVDVHLDELEGLNEQEIASLAAERVIHALKEKVRRENEKIDESQLNPEREHPVTGAVRGVMIQELDRLWMRHLLTMDHLRTDVNLRSVGQRDPLMEFKHEAFRLFHELTHTLRERIASNLFKFEMIPIDTSQLERLLSQMHMEKDRSLVDEVEKEQTSSSPQEEKKEPVLVGPKVKRNDPCPCGSGKKYKKCCGQTEE